MNEKKAVCKREDLFHSNRLNGRAGFGLIFVILSSGTKNQNSLSGNHCLRSVAPG